MIEVRVIRLDRDAARGFIARRTGAGEGKQILPLFRVRRCLDVMLLPGAGGLRQDVETQVGDLHAGVGGGIALGFLGGVPGQYAVGPFGAVAGPPAGDGVAARRMHDDGRLVLPVVARIDGDGFALGTHVSDGLIDCCSKRRQAGQAERATDQEFRHSASLGIVCSNECKGGGIGQTGNGG